MMFLFFHIVKLHQENDQNIIKVMIVNENLIVVSQFNHICFPSKQNYRKRKEKNVQYFLEFERHILHFVSSLELYCKWKPINLDRLDKSITKKTSRNESSSRKTKNKDQHKERKNHNSHQPSSDNEIPKSSTPPKKFRLESQIKVQTPPPPSKLSDNNVRILFYHNHLFIYLLI